MLEPVFRWLGEMPASKAISESLWMFAMIQAFHLVFLAILVGAIWIGTLPPQRFVEFPFVAVNPREETTLTWPVVQTYEGGEIVEWFGPEGSDAPASITRIAAAGTGEITATGLSTWAAGAALLLALLALGLALRPRRSG